MKKIFLFALSTLLCSGLIFAQEVIEHKVSKNTVGFRAGLSYAHYSWTYHNIGLMNKLGTNGQLFINRNLGKKENWQAEFALSHFVNKPITYPTFCGTPPIISNVERTHSLAATVAIRRKVWGINSLHWNHYIGLSAGYLNSRNVIESYYGETVPTTTIINYSSSGIMGLEYSGSVGLCNKLSFQYLFSLNTYPYRHYYYGLGDLSSNLNVGVGYKF